MSLTDASWAILPLILFILPLKWTSADETKRNDDLAIFAGFETFPEAFLDGIGLDDRKDAKHGFYVLTDIEAFFLVARKDAKATSNWLPKRKLATFGKAIRITYQTDPPTDCSVLVSASTAKDGRSVVLLVESPKGSTFTLSGKFEVRLTTTNVVYVPSQTLLENGKRRLYLVLSPHDAEDE